MISITGKTLEKLYENTKKEVNASTSKMIENVIMHGKYNFNEIKSKFILHYMDDAKLWQSTKVPKSLYFTHGQFINKNSKKGIEFIKKELANKPDSGRACLSLVNMEDITPSRDNSLPSFLIMQFCFSDKTQNTINISSYFRALEVQHFMPINLAEACINLAILKDKFPKLEYFNLNMFAFSAQIIQNFHCLKKAEIDYIDNNLILDAVKAKDLNMLIKLLEQKMDYKESLVNIAGITTLHKAFRREKAYDLAKCTKDVIEKMTNLKTVRESISTYHYTGDKADEIKEDFEKLISKIRGWKK